MVTHRKRGKIFHVDFLKGRVHLVRGSLGTRNEAAARTLIHRIEIALAAGAASNLWVELSRVLPEKTFIRFANYVGVQAKPLTTWSELKVKYESDMQKRVQINDFAESTQFNYQKAIQNFEDFLTSREQPIYLVREINRDITKDYKYSRIAAIQERKGPNGGSGYATEAGALHRLFEFAIESGIITENPFHSEPKIRDPKGGAQPYSGFELRQMREHAGEDRLLFLVFRHTGLRSCDVATLTWAEINFGENRIDKPTKKSRYRKTAVIPMCDELRSALHSEFEIRHPEPTDTVLLNPKKGHRLTTTSLRHRIVELGKRAGVEAARPHRYRDSFSVDALLRHVPESSVARMIADTLEAVMDRYVPFVKELQEHAKNLLSTGKGLEDYGDAHPRHNNNVVDDPPQKKTKKDE